jgi:hypothetical protein
LPRFGGTISWIWVLVCRELEDFVVSLARWKRSGRSLRLRIILIEGWKSAEFFFWVLSVPLAVCGELGGKVGFERPWSMVEGSGNVGHGQRFLRRIDV